jgi:predicted  nucleic acid-binding Zn-ribbon protein
MGYARGMVIDRNHPIQPPQYTCLRCGHAWVPRSGAYPRQCPKCGSAYWDRPRTHPQRRPHVLGPRPEPAPRPQRPQARPPEAPPPAVEAAPADPVVLTPQERRAAVVTRLQAMKAQGLSHQAIADRLNAEQVPTLSGNGQWQKGTVGKLLAQAEEDTDA